MNNVTCIKLFDLRGGQWESTIEMWRRIYSTEGISPTLMAGIDGNSKAIKVAVYGSKNMRKQREKSDEPEIKSAICKNGSDD